LTYLLLQHLYTRREARWAVALLAVSPWFLFLGMSFMTHMLTLACGLTTALALGRARRTGSLGWGLLAGAAVGATSLVRPLDGVVIGILAASWSLGVGGRRLNAAAIAGAGIATIAVASVVVPYNAILTGHPLEFPVNAYFNTYYHVNANAYGFGPDRGVGWAIDPHPGHSFVDGLINANLNTFGINTDLFGWGTGSLIFVAAFLCFGRPNRSDRLMLAVIAAVGVAYFFYYFSGGPDFGARYWFVIVVPLVALTVRGIQVLEAVAGPRVRLAVVALMTLTLVNFVPWRAIDKYHHFRGMRADVRALALEHHFGRDLVLVRGNRFPDYASTVPYNPIDLTGPSTVYAWDRSPKIRAEILRAYPDRRVWLIDGPSVTGTGFRIAEGPLSAPGLAPGLE
jgi:4-amino-4-deoxy-L-arabinose transferase-like glycosyltransferase